MFYERTETQTATSFKRNNYGEKEGNSYRLAEKAIKAVECR